MIKTKEKRAKEIKVIKNQKAKREEQRNESKDMKIFATNYHYLSKQNNDLHIIPIAWEYKSNAKVV